MDKVNKQELRRLAEAASHKEWRAGNAYGKAFILKYQIIADTDDGAYVLMEGNNNFPEHSVPNIAYVGAANPAAILSLLDELERAESDAERLRMQLAACGVVAMCNTAESAAKARDMHPDYMSASCQDVMRAVDAEMALREELEQYRRDAESLRGSCKALGEQNKHLTRRVKALARAVKWLAETGWGVARPKWLTAILAKEGGANG